MRKIHFYKYQALENDFLLIDVSSRKSLLRRAVGNRAISVNTVPERAKSNLTRSICKCHTGVGADGVLFVEDRDGVFRMRIFNADGTEAEVSGNGLRIVAQYVYYQKLSRRTSFVIESSTGRNPVTIISSDGINAISRICLGTAKFAAPEIPMHVDTDYFINMPFAAKAGTLVGTAVNVGNPHIVFFVDNFDFDWQAFGREVESDPRFPQRTNVEFAIIKSRRRIVHRSWERGVGVTRASGTGAASAVAAGVINGYLDHKVEVLEPAGVLEIDVIALDGNIFLTGPSVYVGEGTFIYEDR